MSIPGGPVLVDSDNVVGALELDLSDPSGAKIAYALPGGTGLDITGMVASGSIEGLLDVHNDDLAASEIEGAPCR